MILLYLANFFIISLKLIIIFFLNLILEKILVFIKLMHFLVIFIT